MRRSCIGELIQIDGCEHRWFEERAPACTVLVYVDDATSRLMEILFTGSESTFGYFEATRRYLERHGKPLAFYSDKASVFRINNKSATGGDGHTQFGRGLSRARKTPGTKTQRQLNVHDLAAAIASTVKQGSAGRRRNS
jgi:hypothetical protein